MFDLEVLCTDRANLALPPLTNALGGVNSEPGDGTVGRFVNLVGDERPGGLKLSFVGEAERTVAGVAGRESLMRDAGRAGGPIRLSRVAALEARLRVGEGEGDIPDKVSKVLSVSDGRGLRLLRSNSCGFSDRMAVEFSSSSSKTGSAEATLGGVVSRLAACAAWSASRTGERCRLLG